jgi:hypothetical protein
MSTNTVQKPTSIQALDARQRLGELLDLSYYQNKQFRIMRKDKPMAWIVSQPFMDNYLQVLDYIIENKPELADTLAISLDDELREIIEKGIKEGEAGDTYPLESILDD